MADFSFVQKIKGTTKGRKNFFNQGYSMGAPVEKGEYDQTALGMRLWVIKTEKDLRNQFAELFGVSSYTDLDDNAKPYVASMVSSRMQHYKIDDLAKRTEKCSNKKNLNKYRNKFRALIKKMVSMEG